MKNFKLVLKSLVNNEACVEGGRHRPWWIAIILFFLSMIIALVPIFVQKYALKTVLHLSVNIIPKFVEYRLSFFQSNIFNSFDI